MLRWRVLWDTAAPRMITYRIPNNQTRGHSPFTTPKSCTAGGLDPESPRRTGTSNWLYHVTSHFYICTQHEMCGGGERGTRARLDQSNDTPQLPAVRPVPRGGMANETSRATLSQLCQGHAGPGRAEVYGFLLGQDEAGMMCFQRSGKGRGIIKA